MLPSFSVLVVVVLPRRSLSAIIVALQQQASRLTGVIARESRRSSDALPHRCYRAILDSML
jgi:hypothetical protein